MLEYEELLRLAEKFKHTSFRHEGFDISMQSRGEHLVLHSLYKKGEAFSGDLALMLGVSAARISSLLSRMEKKGYVIRQNDRSDGRKCRVILTDSGKEAAALDEKRAMKLLDTIVDRVGLDNINEYLRISAMIKEAILSELEDFREIKESEE